MTPHDLRCAHLVNPLGVAPDRVRLSWLPGGPQRAYQMQFFRNGGESYWDTGRVASAESVDVAYAGPTLERRGRYTWRVRVWDTGGTVSDWSDPATFEVELDPVDGWLASWIGMGRIRESVTPPTGAGPVDPVATALSPAPYLRRVFAVDKPVACGRLYVTALGLYEARLNGHRVGEAFLTPGWTDYNQRVLYQTYDVSGLLVPGSNVLGAILADGWYAGFVGFDAKRAGAHYGGFPELLAQLVITFADGDEQWIVTDQHWRSATGAIRHADLLMGSGADLRLEPRGWDSPGFSGADLWRPVRRRPRLATVLLAADPGPPIRVTDEIKPVSISAAAEGPGKSNAAAGGPGKSSTGAGGRWIVDFGQNLPGWVRLQADGPDGAVVRIRHGEALDAHGGLYTENLRTARQADEFVLPDGPAVLEPMFTQHGFRYAEITGYPGELSAANVVARVVHSDIPAAGSFSSSEPWLDQLFANIDWGQRGNFISVPTDCPQRDERLGWLGDAQIFARTACYNRDVAAFFGKWLDDVADAQLPTGAFTDVAPRLGFSGTGAPAWGDAGVIVPWTVWKMYGDLGVADRLFPAMTAWMDFIERANPSYLRQRELGNSYNDWLMPGSDDTPHELLATAYWAYDAALMAEMAAALGRAEDAAGYRALSSKVRAAFADAFVDSGGRMACGTQTAYVLGLFMDLIPSELRAEAASHLVAAIRAASEHLTTGFVGVGYLLPVLSSCGYSDVAWRLISQRTFPSWRYMIDHGATTIWERWDGWSPKRGFQSPWMNSFNHYALGSVGEWLYRFVLGIDQEDGPASAGFARLRLRPHPGGPGMGSGPGAGPGAGPGPGAGSGPVRWARGSYQSVRGLVRAGWWFTDDQFTYQVEVPPNVTASVFVPSARAAEVRDLAGGAPLALSTFPGLSSGAEEAVFQVGPGIHEFTGPAVAS
ncbi:MAG: family 78 glycoside hydrolase catalytic domain [Streptosporangiaceae bacterium]|nr:family 78 glycoside hydrolase catalytic domain [Streptosporangiaceae bacterium]